jgi:hypothetical protein
MYPVPPKVAQLHIAECIDTLSHSERGRAAGKTLLEFLNESGLSLDSDNWRAIEVLARGCSQGLKAEVRDALGERFDS